MLFTGLELNCSIQKNYFKKLEKLRCCKTFYQVVYTLLLKSVKYILSSPKYAVNLYITLKAQSKIIFG